jgi:pimeloyl-ACP methyl ester carboxylesterase
MYGLKNSNLSPWSSEFWNFSVRDHALKDFPAMLNVIRSETDKKITVIGQSQGALVSMMGLSNSPNLNKYVNLLALLSPALVLRIPTNPLVKLVFTLPPSYFGSPLFFSFVSITQLFIPDFVANIFAFKALEISGMSLLPLDREGAGEVMSSTPSGYLTTDSMRFYVEVLEKGEEFFRDKKGELGGFDVGKVDVPVGLWIGEEDVVIDTEKTVKLLKDEMGNSLVYVKVLEGYGHTDSWYSKDSIERLGGDVKRVIDERRSLGRKNASRSGSRSRSRSRSRSKSKSKRS